MKKLAFEIETLTDIQLSIGNSIETTVDDNKFISEKGCIFLSAYGYDSEQDKDVDVPVFLSIEAAEKLRVGLLELITHIKKDS